MIHRNIKAIIMLRLLWIIYGPELTVDLSLRVRRQTTCRSQHRLTPSVNCRTFFSPSCPWLLPAVMSDGDGLSQWRRQRTRGFHIETYWYFLGGCFYRRAIIFVNYLKGFRYQDKLNMSDGHSLSRWRHMRTFRFHIARHIGILGG